MTDRRFVELFTDATGRSSSRSTATRARSTSSSTGGRNADRFHVRGFSEEGTTTTPFDMVVLNEMSRYHLVMEALKRPRRSRRTRSELVADCKRMLHAHEPTSASTSRTCPRSATGCGATCPRSRGEQRCRGAAEARGRGGGSRAGPVRYGRRPRHRLDGDLGGAPRRPSCCAMDGSTTSSASPPRARPRLRCASSAFPSSRWRSIRPST